MKKVLVILLALMAAPSWSYSGAKDWASFNPENGDSVRVAGFFMSGYWGATGSTVLLSDDDHTRLILLHLQIDAGQLDHQVSAFYANADNDQVPLLTALQVCLETLISRTKDGVHLLNVIYQNVGGWKPFTTWADYKAQHGH